jgi:hypothetical protein
MYYFEETCAPKVYIFLFNLDFKIRHWADVIGELEVYITKHLGGGEIHDLLKGTITQRRDELIL